MKAKKYLQFLSERFRLGSLKRSLTFPSVLTVNCNVDHLFCHMRGFDEEISTVASQYYEAFQMPEGKQGILKA